MTVGGGGGGGFRTPLYTGRPLIVMGVPRVALDAAMGFSHNAIGPPHLTTYVTFCFC